MFGLIYHQPLQYDDYSYPNWAEWVGWSLALSSIMMIPLVATLQILRTPGSFKEVCACFFRQAFAEIKKEAVDAMVRLPFI